MSALYKLAGQYRAMENIDDMPEDAVADTLDGLSGEMEERIDACGMLIRTMTANMKAIDDEIARLKARSEAFGKRSDSVSAYVMECLKAANMRKLPGVTFTASLRAGRQRVEITDEFAVPRQYVEVRESRHIDRRGLKDALEGGDVPGAKLTIGPETLSIK